MSDACVRKLSREVVIEPLNLAKVQELNQAVKRSGADYRETPLENTVLILRERLRLNADDVEARSMIRTIDPLAWTGYVWQDDPKANHLFFSETYATQIRSVTFRHLISRYLPNRWNDSRIANLFVTSQGLHMKIVEWKDSARRDTLLTIGAGEPHITNLPYLCAFPDLDLDRVLTTLPGAPHTIGTIITPEGKPYTEHPTYISAHPIRIRQNMLLAHASDGYAFFDMQTGQSTEEATPARTIFIEDNRITLLDQSLSTLNHPGTARWTPNSHLPQDSRIRRQENRARTLSDLAALHNLEASGALTYLHEVPITVIDALNRI